MKDARHLILLILVASIEIAQSRPFHPLNNQIRSIARGGAVRGSSLWSAGSSLQRNNQSAPRSRQATRLADDFSNVEDSRSEREQVKEEINAFLTRDSRNTFIARVYAILAGQLSFVSLAIFAFMKFPQLQQWMLLKGRIVYPISLAVSTITVFSMSLSERARQSSPLKWQLLALFTIAEGLMIGFLSSLYRPQTVLSAMASTAIATISITLYTFLNKSPKYDLSQWGAGISSMGITFILYGLLHLLSTFGIIPPILPYNESIFCMFASTLFSLYLAYHTRLIVGGKHSKYQLNEKDYVFGALVLYQDITSLFIYLLRLLNDDGPE